MTPVSCFITFESEEGYQRALSLSKSSHHEIKILGYKPQVSEAPEPTNVIWEHRQITHAQRVFRFILSVLIIVFLLMCSFSIIVVLKRMGNDYNKKYVVSDCKQLISSYDPTYINDKAVQNWFDFYHPKAGQFQLSTVSPTLDCFCGEQKKKYGFKLKD